MLDRLDTFIIKYDAVYNRKKNHFGNLSNSIVDSVNSQLSVSFLFDFIN